MTTCCFKLQVVNAGDDAFAFPSLDCDAIPIAEDRRDRLLPQDFRAAAMDPREHEGNGLVFPKNNGFVVIVVRQIAENNSCFLGIIQVYRRRIT